VFYFDLSTGELVAVENMFCVDVQTLDGKSFSITLGNESTDSNKVISLKNAIQKHHGTRAGQQQLTFLNMSQNDTKSAVLSDNETIKGECSVVLCVKPETVAQQRIRECSERKKTLTPGERKIMSGTIGHGEGKYRYDSGATYEGSWRNNKRHGQGTWIAPDGSLFQGQWRQNEMHGTLSMIKSDGRRYDGDWADDRKNGTGVLSLPSGDSYTGNFEDDKFSGAGIYTFVSDGRTYEGNFQDDKRDGIGAVKYKDGSEYQGEWKDDKREGSGSFTWADGQVYRGKSTFGVI
jgi:hypothetical protein